MSGTVKMTRQHLPISTLLVYACAHARRRWAHKYTQGQTSGAAPNLTHSNEGGEGGVSSDTCEVNATWLRRFPVICWPQAGPGATQVWRSRVPTAVGTEASPLWSFPSSDSFNQNETRRQGGEEGQGWVAPGCLINQHRPVSRQFQILTPKTLGLCWTDLGSFSSLSESWEMGLLL